MEHGVPMDIIEEQLLPGIPNEISLNHVATKLQWQAFYTLSSVSRAWLQAIRSRQVFGARVHAHTAETLVPFITLKEPHEDPRKRMFLYSIRDDSCKALPPIQNIRGSPQFCKWVCMRGKIYLCGGAWNNLEDISKRWFVLDLVGQCQWTECASMQERRVDFEVAVLHGKIYVLGGWDGRKAVRGAEVYDPEGDSWSSITPMTALRFHHVVDTVGEELLVHDGFVYSHSNRLLDPNSGNDEDGDRFQVANFVEVYHPAKNEWRLEKAFGRDGRDFVFVAQGKIHCMTFSGIYVLDGEKKTWTHLHSFVFPCFDGVESFESEPFIVLVVDDELLVSASWKKLRGMCLVYSKGFGGGRREIVWQRAVHEFDSAYLPRNSCGLLQL